jgi:hypothetical protein
MKGVFSIFATVGGVRTATSRSPATKPENFPQKISSPSGLRFISRLLMERNHYPARIPGDTEREGNRSRLERTPLGAALHGPASTNPCNCKRSRRDFLLSDIPKTRHIAIKPDGEPVLSGRVVFGSPQRHDLSDEIRRKSVFFLQEVPPVPGGTYARQPLRG